MAQDPSRPKDDGKVRLPKVSPGENKIAPASLGGGKGSKKDPANITLGAEDKGENADNEKLLIRARKRFDRALSAESDNRSAWLDDLKFKAGDQWPTDVKIARNQDKRPCLTINKIPTFVHQVTNDLRQNRPSINVSPVGDRGDPEAAKMFRGLIRAIERDSSADIAYDTAADLMVTCGRGIVQIVTEYERGDDFDQVIRVKRIRNQFTVYLDPDHQEPDFADGRYAFVTEMIPRDEFKDEYPDADPMPWSQAGIGESLKNWIEPDAVRVALYYEVQTKTRRLVELSNGHTGWEDELDEEVQADIDSGKIEIVNERESERRTVKCYKLTAKEILEEFDWVGSSIPLVPFLGDETDIEGKVKLSGVVRSAKDPQRMYNFWRTLETEMIALQPKAPFIGAEGQFEGHEQEWKQANTRNFPYLEYKPLDVQSKPAPPPQRQPMTGPAAGIEAAIAGASQDMQATTGIRFDATMNERMTDESGRAIRELRRTGDLTTFHYPDNMGRGLRRIGAIFIEIIPKVYDTKRVLTILREDDTEDRVQIDPHAVRAYEEIRPQPTEQNPTPKTLKIFNPNVGRYGVTVTIGPSFATKRIEASESMVAFAKAVPNVAALIADLIAKNQDWPGAEEIAKRLAKAVPPQLMTADQKDIPPQVQAMLQALQTQLKQMMQERQQLITALTEKASDRALAKDKIDKDFKAKLLKILGDVEKTQMQVDAGAASDLATSVRDLLASADEGEKAAPDPIEMLQRQNAEMQFQLNELTKTLGKPKRVKVKKGADGAYEMSTDYGEDKPKEPKPK